MFSPVFTIFSCMQFNLDYFTLTYLLEIWIPFSAVSNWIAFNVSIKFFQLLYFSVLVFSFDVFLKHYSSLVNCFILSSTFIYTLVLVILNPTFTSANTGVIYAFIIYKNICNNYGFIYCLLFFSLGFFVVMYLVILLYI